MKSFVVTESWRARTLGGLRISENQQQILAFQ